MNQKVAEAFKKLYFGKRTGVLTCEAASQRRAVVFNAGLVVGAKSTRNEDRLGELLMRHGRITEQQFNDASHFLKSGWRFGEILVELNVLAEEEVEAFVRLQLLEIACMQLISPPKRLAFAPVSEVDSVVEAPISVADIIMEAARRTPKLGKRLEALRSDERRLDFSTDPLRRFQDVNLRPEEAFVLSRIDGTQTASDIFQVSPLSEEQTARTLLGLLTAEVIVPVEADRKARAQPAPRQELETEFSARGALPPSPAPTSTLPSRSVSSPAAGEDGERDRAEVERLFQEIQFKDHFQVLGLDRGASADDVRRAFMQNAKRFHPDRFRRFADGDFQEKLSFVFQRIQEAHDVLSSERRENYEGLLDKESAYEKTREANSKVAPDAPKTNDAAAAKALFIRAKQVFVEGDNWQCIQLCQQAVDLAPQQAEIYHLLGLALANNPKWRQDAEKNLRIAANLDPWKADYQLALAKLYKEVGLHLRAQRALEKAKTIDPAAELPD